MNRAYRLIISHATGLRVVVAEITRGHSKNKTGSQLTIKLVRYQMIGLMNALSLALMVVFPPLALALPQDGVVVSGSGVIAQTGNTMTVNQVTNRFAINWQSFNVGADQRVQFHQPSSSSVVLNRVLGSDPSKIFGQISANGQVFLTNPNGILFGRTAQVAVGGLVATTNQLSDIDWNAGRYVFSKTGVVGSVVNEGNLTAADRGYIALLAPEVKNQGVIRANLGTALLAGGDKVILQLNANSLLGFQIDQGALSALVENKNLIVADGGQVFLSARAADHVGRAVVNHSGVIQAQTIDNKSGMIRLMADMTPTDSGHWISHGRGDLNFSGGLLDVSAQHGGDGGFVETSAANVKIGGLARVTSLAASGQGGTWLIDPIDFTISAGGASLTTSGMGASTLSTILNSTNVTITTDASTGGNGDIFVNADVSWSMNQLTLSAHRNIDINANLNAGVSGKLNFSYGQGTSTGVDAQVNLALNKKVNLAAGDNFFTKQGADGLVKTYTVITNLGSEGSVTATDLQGVQGGLSKNYALGADIDASETSSWNAGKGFFPIGNPSTQFTGYFNGLGHVVDDLKSSFPILGSAGIGLFGEIGLFGVVEQLGVRGVVEGSYNVGSIAGRNRGIIRNSYSTGVVTASDTGGGLVGENYGSIMNSYVVGNVYGYNNIGGLVGRNYGLIEDSYVTGNVDADNRIGGLVSINSGGTIINSYSTGNVDGYAGVAGLVALNAGIVTDSYVMGNVIGDSGVGGFVGENEGTILGSYAAGSVSGGGGFVAVMSAGIINNSYAMGSVSGGGGFAAEMSGGIINNSYATGSVSGNDNVGGFLGTITGGTVSNSYATGPVSGNDYVGGFLGVGNEASVGTVSNSYATGSVSGNNYVGGFLGVIGGGTVSNSYATGLVSAHDYVGGFLGAIYGGTVSNSYATGSVSGNDYVGGFLGMKIDGFYDNAVINSYWDKSTSGTENPGGGVVSSSEVTGLTTTEMMNDDHFTGFDFSTTWWLVDSFTRPFLRSEYSTTIRNAHQLQLIAMDLSASYILAKDISMLDLSNVSGMWGGNLGPGFIPLGNSDTPFEGSFDGKGHTISDLYINKPSDSKVGLFGHIGSDAVISNVHLEGVVLNGSFNVGGLVGHNSGGTVINSSSSGVVSGGSSVGGLVGRNSGGGVIINSSSSGVVSGSSSVGGLIGENELSEGGGLSIGSSYATGNVSGNDYVGGLIGYNYVTGEGASLSIGSSYATGNVSGVNNVGGLIGYNHVTGEGASLSIGSSYATGNVSGVSNVGGLIGYNQVTSEGASLGIGSSYAMGNVSGYTYVGGLIGTNVTIGASLSVWTSYAMGNVIGDAYVGGLIGANVSESNEFSGGSEFSLWTSYAMGNVSGYTYVGGLIGLDDHTSYGYSNISNTYAMGSVSGSSVVGGLVGFITTNVSTISSSYVSASVVATGEGQIAGGLVGRNAGTISSSYWNSSLFSGSSVGTLGGESFPVSGTTFNVAGLTAQELKQIRNFTGFDITNVGGTSAVWRIYDGYSMPLLRNFLTSLFVDNTATIYDGTIKTGRAITSDGGGRTGVAASGINVGEYQAYSNQLGYDISGGALIIRARLPIDVVEQMLGLPLAQEYQNILQLKTNEVSLDLNVNTGISGIGDVVIIDGGVAISTTRLIGTNTTGINQISGVMLGTTDTGGIVSGPDETIPTLVVDKWDKLLPDEGTSNIKKRKKGCPTS